MLLAESPQVVATIRAPERSRHDVIHGRARLVARTVFAWQRIPPADRFLGQYDASLALVVGVVASRLSRQRLPPRAPAVNLASGRAAYQCRAATRPRTALLRYEGHFSTHGVPPVGTRGGVSVVIRPVLYEECSRFPTASPG